MVQQVIVGTIGRPHGLKGEVTVRPHTDRIEERFEIGIKFAVATKTLTVASRKLVQGRLVVHFVETGDRAEAEALRGLELWADAAPESLDDEEFNDSTLIGLAAFDPAGNRLGEVVDVEHHASQDLLVVRTAEGERLVPFVAQLVPEVDPGAGRLVIEPIPGLLSEVSDAD
jgi:16S rRNA processing protein RimM